MSVRTRQNTPQQGSFTEITSLIWKLTLVYLMSSVMKKNFPYFTNHSKPLSQFSHSVVSDSLRPHEPQHTVPPCPSPTAGVYPDPCPLSQWCHPAISSSVIPFSSCPQSVPASGSFPMSQLFASGGKSTGVSPSTSVLPMNTQDWSPLGWTGWISLFPLTSQQFCIILFYNDKMVSCFSTVM